MDSNRKYGTLLVYLLLWVAFPVLGQNLVLNPGLEEINLRNNNEVWGLDGILYLDEGLDTTMNWWMKDKKLTCLYVQNWNYRNTTQVAKGCSGYYSNINLARTGTNLAVIEVFKSWAKVATVRNVAAHLCNPLTKGNHYKVTVQVKPLYGNHFTSSIGFWLTSDQIPLRYQFNPKTHIDSVKRGLFDPIPAPAYRLPNILADTAEYTTITFEYVAQGGEQYLYMGNLFFNDDQFWRKNTWKRVEQYGYQSNNRGWMMCYYVIDDVSVENISNPEGCPVPDFSQPLATSTLQDTVLFEQVYFEFDEYITNHDWSQLKYSLLGTGHAKKVVIIGYTDEEGTDSYNLKLSQQRAEFVRQQLAEASDIPMETIAMGAASQVYTGTQSAKNRRVDVVVLR